ncbi:MAG TPA: PRC-barrel domain-containing protein [Thermomicrobiales bacterium]|nr:PRC-barrel domain-containing protein [Thermomicrobiales bacterium]
MRIDLGMDVLTSDGEKLGTVERLVLDANSKQITEMIVSGGFFGSEDRIVDVSMVAAQSGGSLQLDLPKREAEQLPTYVQQQYVEVPHDDYHSLPFVQANPSGGGLYLYGAPYAGRGYEGRDDSFYDAAPSDAPIVENRSNLEETDTLISTGTDVVGADGDKLGSVDEVYLGTDGEITGFLVKKGLIFTHDIRIPMDWVSYVDGDMIRLNLTASEAETRAYDVEDTTL